MDPSCTLQLFDGVIRPKKGQSYNGASHTKSLGEIMDQVLSYRRSHMVKRMRNSSAITIQSFIRGVLAKKKLAIVSKQHLIDNFGSLDFSSHESILSIVFPIKFASWLNDQTFIRRILKQIYNALIVPSMVRQISEDLERISATNENQQWLFQLMKLFSMCVRGDIVEKLICRFSFVQTFVLSEYFDALNSNIRWRWLEGVIEGRDSPYYKFIKRIWLEAIYDVRGSSKVKNKLLMESLATLILAPL
ncbi:hypothetical protein ACOME3_008572 [Neoechinorhynchus agilis]